MTRARRSTVVVAMCAALAAAAGAETIVPPSDLLRDIKSLDGKHVTVAGTLGRVRTHISKRGDRSYSFRVSDDHATVAVLSTTPPACHQGARVVAQGIVDGRAGRVDATSVSCP
jgi:hypothetical protein